MFRVVHCRFALVLLCLLCPVLSACSFSVEEGPRIPDTDTGIRVCESPVVARGGTQLAYYRFGAADCGNAAPVTTIAIHGVNADGLVYGRLASLMQAQERRGFVSLDLPGHGRSELPDFAPGVAPSPTALADEIIELIDFLAPDDAPRKLVCHSMAGPLCVRLLEQARSRGLQAVLVNPTFVVEGGEVQLLGSARWVPQLLTLDAVPELIQGLPVAEDRAMRGRPRRDLLAREREKIRVTNYRLSGRVDGQLRDLGTPVERRREMFDDPGRRRLTRALNNGLRRRAKLAAWVDDDNDERLAAVGHRLCVLVDPGDTVVDGSSTLARVELLNIGLGPHQRIGVHVLPTMQGDHSSINTVPEYVLARVRLDDPCLAPGLERGGVAREPAAVERLLADVDPQL